MTAQLALFPDPVDPPTEPVSLSLFARHNINGARFYYAARLLQQGATPTEAAATAGLTPDHITLVRRYVEHPRRTR